MPRHWIWTAWLATGTVLLLTMVSDSRALEIVAGVLLVGVGLVVSTNFRGAADAMSAPIGPFRRETRPGLIRLIFAFFALVGVLLVSGVLESA